MAYNSIVAMTPDEYIIRENERRSRDLADELKKELTPILTKFVINYFERAELENENLRLQNLKLRKELGLG